MWTRKLSIQLNLAHLSSWNPPFCALDCNQNADQVASPKIRNNARWPTVQWS